MGAQDETKLWTIIFRSTRIINRDLPRLPSDGHLWADL